MILINKDEFIIRIDFYIYDPLRNRLLLSDLIKP